MNEDGLISGDAWDQSDESDEPYFREGNASIPLTPELADTCRSCQFWKGGVTEYKPKVYVGWGGCHRYPQTVKKNLNDGCGEWQLRAT